MIQCLDWTSELNQYLANRFTLQPQYIQFRVFFLSLKTLYQLVQNRSMATIRTGHIAGFRIRPKHQLNRFPCRADQGTYESCVRNSCISLTLTDAGTCNIGILFARSALTFLKHIMTHYPSVRVPSPKNGTRLAQILSLVSFKTSDLKMKSSSPQKRI